MINYGNIYKYIDKICDGYYNPKKILTYRRQVNVVTGSRSVGKSTAISLLCVFDYIINGHLFIYSRRDNDELIITCRDFFDDAVYLYNEYAEEFNLPKIQRLYYEARKYYIEIDGVKKLCGFTVPMNKENKYKSGKFGDVYTIIYDEFIARDSNSYIGTKASLYREEYIHLRSLVITCDRRPGQPIRNEVCVFLLGNTDTIYAPLLLHLGVTDYLEPVEGEAKFIAPKEAGWVYQSVGTVEAVELARREKSLIDTWADDEEINYNNNNGIGNTDKSYIDKLPKHKEYIFTISKDGSRYGVWRDAFTFNYYISKKYALNADTISLDIKSHKKQDLAMVTKFKENPMLDTLVRMFKIYKLFFTDGKTKQAFLKYFQLMP